MIRRLLAHRRYMREHRWTHARLSEYLDEELVAEQAARVEEHVSICPHCRRVLATLRRTLDGLRSLGSAPHAGVADAVIERLREQS
jgi:anti-sigma factor RsiW